MASLFTSHNRDTSIRSPRLLYTWFLQVNLWQVILHVLSKLLYFHPPYHRRRGSWQQTAVQGSTGSFHHSRTSFRQLKTPQICPARLLNCVQKLIILQGSYLFCCHHRSKIEYLMKSTVLFTLGTSLPARLVCTLYLHAPATIVRSQVPFSTAQLINTGVKGSIGSFY